MDSASSHPRHRQGGFQPPHCPNPRCAFHRPNPHWRFAPRGSFVRHSDLHRFRAFRCCHCGRNFSPRSFSSSCGLRLRHLLIPIAAWLPEGPGLRQIGRVLGTSHTTVARYATRLGHHCRLFQHAHLQNASLAEPLVIDGFESFARSQFFPFHANLAVGADSWMIYHFTYSPLRRKGAMTPYQKLRRAELELRLGRPDPKAVELGIVELLRPLLKLLPTDTLLLHSDDHPAYPRALRRLRTLVPNCPRIDHCITPSTVRRTQSNPLFPVNLADLLLRHGSANHRRETIAFSKCPRAAFERLAVFVVWRNFIKRRREKESWPTPTAAMRAGVIDRPLRWRQVLRRRLFPDHADPPVV